MRDLYRFELVFCFLSLCAPKAGHSQVYFSGRFGPSDTWNVYEVRGLGTIDGIGRWRSRPDDVGGNDTLDTEGESNWIDAAESAGEQALFGELGHLAAFADPVIGRDENDFVRNHLLVPRGDYWIGLSDSVIYGGSDAGENDVHVDRGAGWAWQGGEAYEDVDRWSINEPDDCCGGQDAVALASDGRWVDLPDGQAGTPATVLPYVVEYEIHWPDDPSQFLDSQWTYLRIPGPKPVRNGAMTIREIAQRGSILDHVDGLNALFSGGGINYGYEATTLNLSNAGSEGQFGGDHDFGLVEGGISTPGDLDDVALVANGRVRISPEEAGQRTFHFYSNDSGELWIYGQSFDNVSGRLGSTVSPYGSLLFRASGSPGDTLGVIDLPAGEYDFEFVGTEHTGNAAFELSSAKGLFTDFDPLSFQLLGAAGGLPLVYDICGWVATYSDDGDIDLTDLNNVRNNFGSSDGLGDTNGDNLIDLNDLNNVRNCFGRARSPQAVPEPSSLALLAAGTAGFAAFLRRQRN